MQCVGSELFSHAVLLFCTELMFRFCEYVNQSDHLQLPDEGPSHPCYAEVLFVLFCFVHVL